MYRHCLFASLFISDWNGPVRMGIRSKPNSRFPRVWLYASLVGGQLIFGRRRRKGRREGRGNIFLSGKLGCTLRRQVWKGVPSQGAGMGEVSTFTPDHSSTPPFCFCQVTNTPKRSGLMQYCVSWFCGSGFGPGSPGSFPHGVECRPLKDGWAGGENGFTPCLISCQSGLQRAPPTLSTPRGLCLWVMSGSQSPSWRLDYPQTSVHSQSCKPGFVRAASEVPGTNSVASYGSQKSLRLLRFQAG